MPDSQPPTSRRSSLGWTLVLVIGLLLIAGVALMPNSGLWPRPATTAVLGLTSTPAFTIITAGDMTPVTVTLPLPAGVFTDTQAAVGRLTLTAVPLGAPLSASDLLAVPADAWLITVPLSGTLTPQAGEYIVLLGVQVDTAELISDQALCAGIVDGQAVVVLPAAEAQRAAAYLFPGRRLIALRRAG
ncbi:MAG: SAF domain-containing protein [Anaerolineae bacterium]|uniref:SAF domain-containing protein n=1 Tax=Candidatus Amarolinea dominans TaxID=3140696 RepID=UPI0031349F96|nr:SAF domain-containing protein [Anaerolineae bacterium]